jgi:4-hydroxymandelate oxidase
VSLVPRVLRGRGLPVLAVDLLGKPAAMPVFLSPTAFHRLADPEGERATARAAAAAGVVMSVSMASTTAVEELAKAGGRLWFQLYVQPDLAFTRAVIRRAEAAGCEALVLTVDSPVFGRRLRDLRHRFTDLPPGLACEHLREPTADGYGAPRQIAFSADVSWEHVSWLRRTTQLPLVLKGILHPDDARLAVEHGVDAVLVSNHGGRQLDGVPATLAALPAVADAVAGRIPVLMDGGIRRGTDVVKALALGATAVGLGRPVLWGLAAAGEAGVGQVLGQLRAELAGALALVGLGAPGEAGRALVRAGAPEEVSWPES